MIVNLLHYLHLQLKDRKSTRLNSSHGYISYAVFCLKKKKIQKKRVTESDVCSSTLGLAAQRRRWRASCRSTCAACVYLSFHFWCLSFFFFFNDTATTEIYTLSLHDALPIFGDETEVACDLCQYCLHEMIGDINRKRTRLNSTPRDTTYAGRCSLTTNKS